MKTRSVVMSFSLIIYSHSFLLGAQKERERSFFNVIDDFSDEILFEEANSFQEPEIADIVIERERKPEISIKDVPFYLKLFCSYVYEEKLQRWYYSFFGYLAHWKHKKINFRKQRWGK